MAKKTKRTLVQLVAVPSGLTKDFDISHAERLLEMGNINGGWQLPATSKYSYDEENGLRLKTDTAGNTKA